MHICVSLLEPTTGIEPVTSSLPRKCSTTELCGRLSTPRAQFNLERVMGIEPTLSAWKAEVLPLNYTRNCLNGGGGRIRTFEAETADLQSAPFNHSGTPPKVQARIFSWCRL
jgi:hypothetical protein